MPFLLVHDLDGEFDLVGLFVGVEFDEGFEETGHSGSASFDEVLEAEFLFGLCTPVNGFLTFVFVVVREVEDVGTLELESTHAGNFEFTAVEALFGKAGDGFFGCGVNDLVYLSLDGFSLGRAGCAGFVSFQFA